MDLTHSKFWFCNTDSHGLFGFSCKLRLTLHFNHTEGHNIDKIESIAFYKHKNLILDNKANSLPQNQSSKAI